MITTENDICSAIPFNEVRLTDTFWLPRLETQKRRTLPFAIGKSERAIENLRRCGNFLKGKGGDLPVIHRFISSDLYKVMEGAAYLIMLQKDEELEALMDEIIGIIAEAQKEDGYLYVSHICGLATPDAEMGMKPYSFVLHSHELYNVGHLYEGAVAYFQATGKTAWLEVAEKSARHVHKVFFEGDPNYNDGKPVNQAPGHQEIEIGLCKLYSVTGDRLYLEMAKRFLDIRGVTFKLDPEGKGTFSPEYAQQHEPVAKQKTALGHSVRAAYMYAAMADVGSMTQDDCYDDALDGIWSNIVDTRMHITGGLGAIHGIEGFGPEYDLPNKDAYNETCAAIGNVFFNHRLFMRHKDAKYFDVAEVALFNNSLAGVNMEGDRFHYVNPLEADGVRLFNHGNAGRAPWFDCACCPSNIARLMPQISGYMYATTYNEIYCLLYGSSETKKKLGDGFTVAIDQESNYPFEGKVKLSLSLESSKNFIMKLRIPTWTKDQFVPGALYDFINSDEEMWTVEVNGEPVLAQMDKGFAVVEKLWNDGDVVELNLPMPVRYSTCSEKVEENLDRIAITRGPLVYCAEEVDNDGLVQRFILQGESSQAEVTYETLEEGPLQGMVSIQNPSLELVNGVGQDSSMKLIPYFAWNNRGNGSMNVWFPKTEKLAQEALEDSIFNNRKYGKVSATFCAEGDSVEALSDGRRPQSANDKTLSRWTSFGQAGKSQTVFLEFPESQKMESLGVYWVDNEKEVCIPKSWDMEYLKNGEWLPFKLYVTDFFGLDKNMYIVVHPSQDLICEGLRLNIHPQDGKSVGLYDLDLMVS